MKIQRHHVCTQRVSTRARTTTKIGESDGETAENLSARIGIYRRATMPYINRPREIGGSTDRIHRRKDKCRRTYAVRSAWYILLCRCAFFFDVSALYLLHPYTATAYLAVGFFSLQGRARAHESERGFGLRGKVRQEIHGEERERVAVAGGTERGEETRWKMGGRRRKREAPNTQHNPAASSASMDFKRSPRLLLFPFLSFSFFYYYFRGVRSGWMRARARTSMCSPRVYQIGIYMLCVLVCTYICTRIRASVRVRSFQVELGRAWVGLDAWKPWTTLGRLVGFPPRLSARIEAHRHGSNVGTTAAA